MDDRAAFSALYTSQTEPILRFFARRVYDPQLALDLAAETFAQAFVDRSKFRGETEAESVAWLYAIARRRLALYFRKGSIERKALDRLGIDLPSAGPEELERVEHLADLASARSAIREGLQGLDDQQQLALRLRIVEERPYQEVARTLGVSEQTARARVSRALRALGEAVDLDPITEEAS